MAARAGACAFCGANAATVPTGVLDEKWTRRFGGDPAVALDHGWYTVRGERRAADHLDPSKFFGASVRALCDYCVHGWVEDVRWRAEPTLLSLAQGRPESPVAGESGALARWAQLTAMLAELIDGMPRAASAAQRDAVRRGAVATPRIDTWVFAMRQRLPARVHLSQVPVPSGPDGSALVQVVSVDLAHLSVLVVLPSDGAARDVVDRADVRAGLGAPESGEPRVPVTAHPLDLNLMRHPHQIALQRVCEASGTSAC